MAIWVVEFPRGKVHKITPRGRSQTTRRGVGGQKNRLFVNFYTIENVNGGG